MNQMETAVTKRLRITYPIIQAPMAGGITSVKLVAAASENGALGMIGAGYMTAEDLEQHINHVKKQTKKPFGVNIFIPETIQKKQTANQAKNLLKKYYETYNITETMIHIPEASMLQQIYKEQINVVLEQEIPVVSFTFGIPDETVTKQFKQRGITVIGTAETVDEALELEASGIDMVVVQGSEAGGHRGGFNHQKNGIGLMALLPQATNALSIPIIAAGGIMGGRGLVAARVLGAAGVQMGTAFLLTTESGAHPEHKHALLTSKETDTVMTSVFSGKPARGLDNAFIEEMKPYDVELPDYPVMNSLTQPIRKAAKADGNDAWMSLWSGQALRLAKCQTVAQLIKATMDETTTIIDQFKERELDNES